MLADLRVRGGGRRDPPSSPYPWEMGAWAIEPATNPSVVRIHVAEQLTDRTIVTSPPAEVAMPMAGLLEIEAVRTIDVHRYRIRLNLRPGSERVRTTEH